MGFGILNLINIGKENIFLSGDPEITFFKISYKKYTNFSIEQTPQYFKTTPDFGRRCTVNIGKNADLMHNIYLYVELPFINLPTLEEYNFVNKFAWVEKIGIALINFIEIEIGGNLIDRHYGEWINIWHELTVSNGLKKSFNKMIGNIPELINYSKNKNNNILYIPLLFWFCQDISLSLPLISLFHNDIKIHIDFNDFDKCYKLSPSHYIYVSNTFCLFKEGELIIQNIQNTQNIGEFIYFDESKQILYYNELKGNFIIPTNNDITLKIIGKDSKFEIFIQPNTIIIKNNYYFKFNKPSLISAYLLVDYIYLDNYERLQFINNSHEYLIQVVQSLPEQIIYSINSIYKLPLYNPIKFIIWRAQLLSNQNINNWFNYTIYPYTNMDNFFINKMFLVINSIKITNINSYEYYTYLQKYQYKLLGDNNNIYMYSFSLHPNDLQPSGCLNFSTIDNAYIQLNTNNFINYQNPISIKVYASEYNLLRIFNGIAGLVFNL